MSYSDFRKRVVEKCPIAMPRHELSRAQRYLKRLKHVTTRAEAADVIRAYACHSTAKVCTYTMSVQEKIRFIEQVERKAEMIENEFVDENGMPREYLHPWRQWLEDWGFVPPIPPGAVCGDCASHELEGNGMVHCKRNPLLVITLKTNACREFE